MSLEPLGARRRVPEAGISVVASSMAANNDEDVGDLSYREVQHKLKALGLPAKG